MDTFSNSERREKIRYVEWWVGSGGDRWLSCKYYSRPRYRTISWLIRFRWISTSHTTDIESLYDEITCRLICPANVHLYNISQIRAIVIRLFTTACPIGHSMHPPLPLFPTRVRARIYACARIYLALHAQSDGRVTRFIRSRCLVLAISQSS